MIASKVIKCSDHNLYETYSNNYIGRNDFLHRFVYVLGQINEATTIAVDGDWGCGKTFFVKQAKMIMDAHNDYISANNEEQRIKIRNVWNQATKNKDYGEIKPQVSVYYDAWLHDDDTHPLLSLVFEIYRSVQHEYSFEEFPNVIDILGKIADASTSRNLSGVIDSLRSKKNPFEELTERQALASKIKEFLGSLIHEKGDRLIVYIDELDRCNPNFAVRLLEKIKHYFDNDDITFVLSINSFELQNTIRNYYGSEFNASRYLNRFFDLRFSLPPVDTRSYLWSIGENIDHYPVAKYIIERYGFQMRDIAKYIRLLNISFPRHIDFERRFNSTTYAFCCRIIVPLMIGMQMYDITKYKSFIEGNNRSELDFMLEIKELSNWINWFVSKENENIDAQEQAHRLTMVYNALFSSTVQHSEQAIGRLRINSNIQNTVKEVVSLLSNMAYYNDND